MTRLGRISTRDIEAATAWEVYFCRAPSISFLERAPSQCHGCRLDSSALDLAWGSAALVIPHRHRALRSTGVSGLIPGSSII